MYGQGNFAPHFGRTPRTSVQPFQQCPPTLSHHFQQGLQVTHPAITQQGPALAVSHAGQFVSSVYQHGPPVPPSLVLSSGQSYLNPPSQLQIPVPNSYTYVHSNSQWSQSAHYILPPPPPPRPPIPTSTGPSSSETLQFSSSSTVLPSSLQGQVLFRGAIHPPTSDSQGLQHIQPPHLPPSSLPTSNFYTPSLECSVHLNPQNPHMPSLNPSLAPPPPSSPPGPPPLPPSPSSASSPHSKALLSSTIKKSTGLDVIESPADVPDNAFKNNDHASCDGQLGYIMAIQVEEGRHSRENTKSDHSPCQLKPVEDREMRKIDILSDAVVSHLPDDSDMDMEDDITPPDEVEIAKLESISIPCEVAKEQLHAVQSAVLAKDSVSGNLFCVSAEQAEGHGYFNFGGSFSKVDPLFMNPEGTAKCSLDDSMDKSSVSHGNGLNQSKTSTADTDISPEKNTAHPKTGASPFRRVLDYASNDGSESDDELCKEANIKASTISKSGTSSFVGEVHNCETDLVSKTFSVSKQGLGCEPEPVIPSSLSMPSSVLESPVEPENVARDKGMITVVAEKEEEHVDNSRGITESTDNSIPHKIFEQKGPSTGPCVNTTADSGKLVMENVEIKVDEFGRLVREGYSNSDADDSPYSRRHSKRGRSCSRSRSPHGRSRSHPRRRRENLTRSRSRSTKRRRSRSRSPSFRHKNELGGDRMRRDKSQLPQCFDFLRGRCYRGAFCRYWHDDSGRSDRSRSYKGKKNEPPPSSKCHDLYKDIESSASKKPIYEDELKSLGMKLSDDISGNSLGLSKDGMSTGENTGVSIEKRDQQSGSGKDDELLVAAKAESEMSAEVIAEDQEKQSIEGKLLSGHKRGLEMSETIQLVGGSSADLVLNDDTEKLLGDTSHSVPSCTGSSMTQQSQSRHSDLLLLSLEHKPKQMDHTCINNSTVQTSSTVSNTILYNEPHQTRISLMKPFSYENLSFQPTAPTDLSPPVSHPLYHLSPQPLLQGTYAQSASQLPGGYSCMPRTAKYPFYSASMENYSPYQPPMPFQQFTLPFNSSWNSLLPLPPQPQPLPLKHPSYASDSTPNAANALHGAPSLQFQQHLVLPRGASQTIARSCPREPHLHSEDCKSQHLSYTSAHEPDQPLLDMKDSRTRTRTVPVGSQMNQPPVIGEGQFVQPLVQGLMSSNLFAQENMHSRYMYLSKESPKIKMHALLNENLPPSEVLSQSPQSHLFLQQPSLGLHNSGTDSVSIHLDYPNKVDSTMSRCAFDLHDRNQPCSVSDVGGSRIMSHYNPYASTFDRPLPSTFSSVYINQEKEALYSSKYGSQFTSSHVPVNVQDVQSLGSRNMTSSPNSARVYEWILPRAGGDQYDPLFDSIEPSPNKFRKSDFGQKREATDDSDIILRFRGSNKPLDVEENNKQQAAAALSVTISAENEEYGETADAEIGIVENESMSNPIAEENMAMGEVEIDQVKTSGKGKKRKDSRSMKPLRVALANFVKELLKPSWRQGNMSKEAFKTIVKKTVDKVSGTMKCHHMPKSQAKIDQYIDSSQRKLTKLVMSYANGVMHLVL